MKMNKKMIMTLSFCLGLLLLASTAFADIANKSGYDQLKDAVKFTSQSVSDSLQSVTMKATITLKDNDTVLLTGNTTQKMDLKKQMSEKTDTTEYSGGNTTITYSYQDANSNIWYNQSSDTYYVTEYSSPNQMNLYQDPFKEDRVEDVEKIFDAVVGNLKDYVLVQENADGSKEFSGSLSEAQIPALANAVTSFLFKQAFSERNMNNPVSLPQISKDIFIKNVKGKATVNKDGLIDSVFAIGVLSGKDTNGTTHDLTLEIAGRIVDINATTVQKPDLEGKKVEKNTVKNTNPNTLSSKFVGTYKCDVVIEKDDAFVKIGEKFLVIAHIDGKNIAGHYYEVYKAGYEENAQNATEFTFDSAISDPYNIQIQYKDKEGKTQIGSLNFDMMSARIYLWLDNQKTPSDSTFSRVFED